jgi:hypothetical protein
MTQPQITRLAGLMRHQARAEYLIGVCGAERLAERYSAIDDWECKRCESAGVPLVADLGCLTYAP